MNPLFIETLAHRLKGSSVALCEYEENGAIVRMRFGSGKPTLPAEAGSVGSTESRGREPPAALADTIKTKAAGKLLSEHPVRVFSVPCSGELVAQGQIVGFLQIGEVLSAVTAHRAGVLGSPLVPDGAVVGYGEPVLELTIGCFSDALKDASTSRCS